MTATVRPTLSPYQGEIDFKQTNRSVLKSAIKTDVILMHAYGYNSGIGRSVNKLNIDLHIKRKTFKFNLVIDICLKLFTVSL